MLPRFGFARPKTRLDTRYRTAAFATTDLGAEIFERIAFNGVDAKHGAWLNCCETPGHCGTGVLATTPDIFPSVITSEILRTLDPYVNKIGALDKLSKVFDASVYVKIFATFLIFHTIDAIKVPYKEQELVKR